MDRLSTGEVQDERSPLHVSLESPGIAETWETRRTWCGEKPHKKELH